MWNAGPSATEILYDAGRRRAHLRLLVNRHRSNGKKQFAALYREQVLSAFRDVEDQLAALRVLEEEAAVTARAVESARRSTELSTIFPASSGKACNSALQQEFAHRNRRRIELTNERNAAALVAARRIASERPAPVWLSAEALERLSQLTSPNLAAVDSGLRTGKKITSFRLKRRRKTPLYFAFACSVGSGYTIYGLAPVLRSVSATAIAETLSYRATEARLSLCVLRR